MSIRVGEVIAVHGTKVILKIDEQSSKETLFHDGEKYKGVSIREYLSIQRGFRDIICMVEGNTSMKPGWRRRAVSRHMSGRLRPSP